MRLMNNLVQLAGALANDPDLKQLSDGSYVAQLRLRAYSSANSRRGNQSRLQFFHLRAFGTIAQELERHFHKGSQLMVRGELRNRVINENDTQIQRTEVQVFEFVALGKPDCTRNNLLDTRNQEE